MNEGCEHMMQLALEAGFTGVKRVDTKGHPSVFGVLDAGAKRTVGLYFMSDVKQADPAEWSSPPFEARLVDKPGFEVNPSGGYNPTSTARDAAVIRAQVAVYERRGLDPLVWPRNAGSYPGYIFTDEPLKLPAGHFGLGHGGGAHAPDEYFVIEPSHPKIAGWDQVVMGYVDYLNELAAIA
jgi:acetylornithine deacetylase/succinyl-diaminopimelate desuccinylase-like protein